MNAKLLLYPGEYYVSSSIFYYRSNNEGSRANYPSSYADFILRPGEISFTPVIFGQENYKKSDGTYSMRRRAISDSSGIYQKQIYESLLEEFPEEIGSWDNTSFVGK